MSIELEKITKNLSPHRNHKIWAIGGGKGGVGKSLITANLSIYLSLLGLKVVSVDLDLGGANLHTCLGIPIPDSTLSDHFSNDKNLKDLMVDTPIKNLYLISGAKDNIKMADIKQNQRIKILNQLNKLDTNYILLDLGAGTTTNTLDFFISADTGILVTLPEPTSIENTYRFIRSIFYRKLKLIDGIYEFGPMIDNAFNETMKNNTAPILALQTIMESHPMVGEKLNQEINNLKLKLIINQVRNQNDVNIGHSIKLITKKYFGLNVEYIGYLPYDASFWQSLKSFKPFLLNNPHPDIIRNFNKITTRLMA